MTADRAHAILALFVAAAWLAAGAAVFVGYRPGGAADGTLAVVALLPIVPALVVARTRGGGGAVTEPIGRLLAPAAMIGALLLLVPLTAELVRPAGPGWPGAQPGTFAPLAVARLLPSPSLGWAFALAAALTALPALRSRVPRRSTGEGAPREGRAVAAAAAVSLVLGAVLAAVGYGIAAWNAGTVAVPATSVFGPTGPVELPACDGPLALPASVRVRASGDGDRGGRSLGGVVVDGARMPEAISWSGTYSTVWGSGTDGRAAGETGPFLDEALLATALTPGRRAGADELGIDLVEGARARHCRVVTDGTGALRGFLPLQYVVGRDGRSEATARLLAPWRGTLDYWLFGDGRLGLASVAVDGLPPGDWPGSGPQARLRATLSATDRGS
ncbi:MAG: hypothetical protein A2X23_04790 [Chloroflexi bacterium GWC2_73_18]|nr:MAG: hypothetical protein A2X23_04790 [Chloroflexi bacterium GWC2_73_18]